MKDGGAAIRPHKPGRRVLLLLAGLAIAAIALAAGFRFVGSASPTRSYGTSPAVLTARSQTVGHYEYVFAYQIIDVYDVDHANRLVQRIRLPQTETVRGAVASPATQMLFISEGGQGGASGNGSLLAYDLRTGKVAWHRSYSTGVDSIAITPNGKTIYLPVGEQSGNGTWEIVDASNGKVTGSIEAGAGAHNTIVGLDGKNVYLAGVDKPYLAVASTATNTIVREIGPLSTGGRPFTINGAQTLAFTTAENILGFQVSSIGSGKVLYTVRVPGFPYDPATFRRSPSHGIALSPDERRLYVIDTPNGYVHAFDVSRLPAAPPRMIASVKLHHPPPNDGWLQLSRDGRYLYVGRAGDVIDTRTLKVTGFLAPLRETATSIEIDWQHGRVVGTTSRYSVGYASS